MYWVNPSTWWIAGVLSKTLANIPVICEPNETAQFTPPPGQTCDTYAGAFATSSGGYLLDPTSTTLCQYCPYRSGNNYLSTLNISPNDAWRNLGIFVVYVISNYALVYFFIWSIRIKGWGFGFGALSGAISKAGESVGSIFKKKEKKTEG